MHKLLQEYLKMLDEIENTSILDEGVFYEKYRNYSFILTNPIYQHQSFMIYRSRLASSIGAGEDINCPQTFSYIPKELTTSSWPNRGRLNKTGQSLFYGSLMPDTNYKEIKHDVKVGDEVYLSQWKIKGNSNLRVYNMYAGDNVSCNCNQSTVIGIGTPDIVNSQMGDYIKRLAHIFYFDRDYLKSSLISNYILNINSFYKRNGKRNELTFDAITYSSTQRIPHIIRNLNIAIKPEAVDSKMDLQYVVKGKLLDDLQSVSFEKIGLLKDLKIIWYDFSFEPIIESIRFLKISDGNKYYDANKCHIYDANNHRVARQAIEGLFAKKEKQEALCNAISSNDIFNKSYSYDSNLQSIINEKIITTYAIWLVYNWHFNFKDKTYQASQWYFEEKFLIRSVIE